jgi:hypothetical protein
MGFLNNPSKMSNLKFFLKNTIDTLDRYSTLLVAIATIALAIFTALYIREARQMRIETKRLADLSVEQFKIRAYPSFLIVVKEVKFESDKMTTVFEIYNKGEITANKVTFLWVHGYSKPSKRIFISELGTYYGVEKKHTTVDYQFNILSNSFKKITSIGALYKNFAIENLLYGVLFIKFWVPYDDQYRYESFGYKLIHNKKKKKKNSLSWQEIDIESKKNFINNYFKNRDDFDKRVKNFFKDYPLLKKE